MEFVIRILNGEPLGNPIYVSHMKAAFSDFTTDPLPSGYAEFFHKSASEPPEDFHVLDHSYAWENGRVTDLFVWRAMTPEEKAEEISKRRQMEMPPSMAWDEASATWKRRPVPSSPVDGGPYRFDPLLWQWVNCPEPPLKGFVLSDDGKRWKPPVPRPQDGKQYRWDEGKLQWVLVNG